MSHHRNNKYKKNQMEILELKHKITKIFKKSNGWQTGDNRGKSQG